MKKSKRNCKELKNILASKKDVEFMLEQTMKNVKSCDFTEYNSILLAITKVLAKKKEVV